MTLDDLFNKAKQGIDTSLQVELVMKDVYVPGTVTYAGAVKFGIDRHGHSIFGGATREEYQKTLPSRLAIQIISLETDEAETDGGAKPDARYLATILPSPPFVAPNEAFGPESFVPRVTTSPESNGVTFDDPAGSIQVILHN